MELKGKKVLVFGAGKSGIGASGLLAKLGADTVLYDENEKLDAAALAEKVPGCSVAVGRGEAPEAGGIDLVVASPGIPLDAPGILAYKAAGVPVTGEVELAFWAEKGEVLAVTGTNGKTTTTALLGAIMAASGRRTIVAGNIGEAYTGKVLQTTEDSVTVAEISSFQLETADTFHPAVSAILNITPDHLNRHKTMEEYIRVKELIAKNQTADEPCVLNYEDEALRAFGEGKCPAKAVWFSSARELSDGMFLKGGKIYYAEGGESTEVIDTASLKLIGVHNFENVMAAALMAHEAGVDFGTIRTACEAFAPVPHRIEFVAEKDGVAWYNDSKGTNPDAAIKGIEAMSRPTLLIAGGYDKGSDYTEWLKACIGRVKLLVLEGATAENIKASALAVGIPADKIRMCADMNEAMELCRREASAGDAVLLSPACASWGEFPNYEVRGDVFREFARK